MKDFDEMISLLSEQKRRYRVVAVNGSDDASFLSLKKAQEMGLAEISDIRDDNQDHACTEAVAMIRRGEGDILMKGHVNTDNLMHAILNHDTGIRPKGSILTHISVMDTKDYHKLLLMSDAAIIPFPTLDQRRAQVNYLTSMAHKLGIEEPRVALIHCTEKIDTKNFPVTGDYQTLKADADSGLFGRCRIDGPMDIRCAVSPEALRVKGLTSTLEGDADCLLMPDIESGNLFHKTITYFAETRCAAVLQGTHAPVVLASRGDTPETKFLSLCLAMTSLGK
jgi:phosphate butyryltransferase